MIVFAIILIIVAYACNGIMDGIAQHDSWAKYGHWWSIDSWKDKKFLGAFSWNAWHCFKFLMSFCIVGAILCTKYNYAEYDGFYLVALQFIVLNLLISLGFKLTYK